MIKRVATRLLIILPLIMFAALNIISLAETAPIRTYLTFRITTRAQSAVVNVGEDLQIEVGVDGIVPVKWQWFKDDAAIEEDGDQRVYNLVNAHVEDAGIYRMNAYDELDRLLVSIDVNVRVIDPYALPESGDDSLPVGIAFGTLALGAALIPLSLRKCEKRI